MALEDDSALEDKVDLREWYLGVNSESDRQA